MKIQRYYDPTELNDSIQFKKKNDQIGYKKWTGSSWQYYEKYSCSYCGNYIIRNSCRNKKSEIFCNDLCRSMFVLKNTDQLGHDILDKTGTLEFAYLIGLIASDGHICYNKTNFAVNIELKNNESEIALINKICALFGGKIYSYSFKNKSKRITTIKWYLNNKNFIIMLRQIGFTSNKSLSLDINKWFKSLTEDQKWSFIRGEFDGDGTILKTRFSLISGSKSFAEMIHDFFIENGLNSLIYKVHNKYYKIIINRKKDRILLFNKIYKHDNLKLQRKYKKWHESIAEFLPHS